MMMGVLLGFLGIVAFSLSNYLNKVEDENNCKDCSSFSSCFAKKKIWWNRSTWLDEFMLVSFLKVHPYCMYVKKGTRANRLIYFIVSCMLMVVLFWSRGTHLDTFLFSICTGFLLLLAVVDWNTQFIPFECNMIIFICGIIRLFADFSNWTKYIIGLFAVSVFLVLVNGLATPVLRKQYGEEQEIDRVIGDGDIKLMAATGLLLGWKLNFLALGIGCIAGSVIHLILMKIKGSGRQFALGPYLSLGIYITMICGEQLVGWYLNIMGVKPV